MNKKQQKLYNKYKNLIENKNGILLSTKYNDSITKLKIQCNNNHIFEKQTIKLLKDEWCYQCIILSHNLQCKKIIKEKQGILLNEYINSYTYLKIKCINNHIFNITPDNLKKNTWCKQCLYPTKNEYYLIYKNLIEKQGEKLLSKEYINSKTKLKIQCRNQHIIYILPKNIKNKLYTCIKCNNLNYYKECKQIIENKDSILLSKKYINNYTKLEIKCNNSHIFKINPKELKRNIWCNKCFKYRDNGKNYLKYKKLIEDNNSILLNNYTNKYTNLQIKCQYNHIFNILPINLDNGQFCSQCNKSNFITHKLQEYKNIILQKGGKLLNNQYINYNTKLKIQCNNGHIFYKRFTCIKNKKQWCPKCNIYINEEICRYIFTYLFNIEFKKSRPKWLNRLELDGYNQYLGIAFEYDGEGHYQSIRKSNLQKQQERDKLKNQLCNNNNIILIRIPYYINKINYQNYIQNKLMKYNIIIENKDIINLNNINIYCNKLNEIKNYAISINLILLSNCYLGYKQKLKWKCLKCNNIFDLNYSNLQKRKNKCLLCIKK